MVFDGPGEEVAGDLGVVDCGPGAQPECGGEVQRVGVDGNRFVQDTVGAQVFKGDVLQGQVPGQVVVVDRFGIGCRDLGN
ncbi:hypothetical protein FFT09_09270 [Saccharomonospora piscinae]|nr:hypothetical protein FFT09_09270 [Saccharomonospora piscinae]